MFKNKEVISDLMKKRQKRKQANEEASTKIEWLDFDIRTGAPKPSRKKDSHGYYGAIFDDASDLKDANSYIRMNLAVIAAMKQATSDKATVEFNKMHKDKIKRKTTQGSVSNYLARLDTYGLVVKDKVTKKYMLASGAQEIINDGEALYKRAVKRQQYFKDLIKASLSIGETA